MRTREAIRAGAIGLRNLIVGGNVRLLAKIAQPRKAAELSTQNLFLFDSAFNVGLPKKNVKEVLPHNNWSDLRLFVDSDEFWINEMPCSAADIVSLCMIVQLVRPKRIFEIGTLNGYTALHFAANAPQAEVFTLDLPAETSVALNTTIGDDRFVGESLKSGRLYEGKPECGRIHSLCGDSATFDFAPFYRSIDFFFIDG